MHLQPAELARQRRVALREKKAEEIASSLCALAADVPVDQAMRLLAIATELRGMVWNER